MREEGAGAGDIAGACRLRPSGPRRSRATVRIHNDTRTYGPTAPKGAMANAPDRHNGVTGSPRRCQPHAVPMTDDSALPHRATAEINTRRGVSDRLPACRSRPVTALRQSITSFRDDARPHNPVQQIMANHSAPPNGGVSCQESTTAKKGLAPPQSQQCPFSK